MKTEDPKVLDKVFAALSDPTRRSILSQLKGGDRTILELAQSYDMSLQAVSKHVRVLANAGLISRRKAGRQHFCTFQAAPLEDAITWIAQQHAFWKGSFDNLEKFLDTHADQNR